MVNVVEKVGEDAGALREELNRLDAAGTPPDGYTSVLQRIRGLIEAGRKALSEWANTIEDSKVVDPDVTPFMQEQNRNLKDLLDSEAEPLLDHARQKYGTGRPLPPASAPGTQPYALNIWPGWPVKEIVYV